MPDLRLPGPDDRTVIVGSTGSGKTVVGLWLLSTRDTHARPWFLFNTKGDKHLDMLGATEISIKAKPPEKPGLYMLRPLPNRDDEAYDEFLWRVWQQENCGLYTDEGYMIPKRSDAFRAIQTQGRSKYIETITLSQRPRYMDVFTFSEATFWLVLRLQNKDDKKRVQDFMPVTLNENLTRYYSQYYDVNANRGATLSPVPPPHDIVARIRERHGKRIRTI